MTKNIQKPIKSKSRTKADKMIALLQRSTGATITELAKATGWQKHSVRGFMSGSLKKKQGFQITSTKEDDKNRRYVIEVVAS